MIVTQYATHPTGRVIEGSLFEMKGINLDQLPTDLVAVLSGNSIENATAPYVYFPLDHVSPDGRTAYFRQIEAHTYNQTNILNRFGTPTNPPRTIWNDYKYEPVIALNLSENRSEFTSNPSESASQELRRD